MATGSGAQAAGLHPDDAMMLEQLLGGGMMPPAGAALGAPAPPADPSLAGAPGAPLGATALIPGMPSTDPATYQQVQAADQQALLAAQQAAQQQAAMMPPPATGPGAALLGGMPGMPVDPMSVAGAAPPMGPGASMLMGDPALPLPGSTGTPYGGPDMGSMESENIAPLTGPGSSVLDELV